MCAWSRPSPGSSMKKASSKTRTSPNTSAASICCSCTPSTGRSPTSCAAFKWSPASIVGALMAINGTITVGTFVAYTGMVVLIIWPMRNLGRLVVEMSRGLVSFERIASVIREPEEPIDEAGSSRTGDLRGEITIRHVGFAYSARARHPSARRRRRRCRMMREWRRPNRSGSNGSTARTPPPTRPSPTTASKLLETSEAARPRRAEGHLVRR